MTDQSPAAKVLSKLRLANFINESNLTKSGIKQVTLIISEGLTTRSSNLTTAEIVADAILSDFDIYVKQKNIVYPCAGDREVQIKLECRKSLTHIINKAIDEQEISAEQFGNEFDEQVRLQHKVATLQQDLQAMTEAHDLIPKQYNEAEDKLRLFMTKETSNAVIICHRMQAKDDEKRISKLVEALKELDGPTCAHYINCPCPRCSALASAKALTTLKPKGTN